VTGTEVTESDVVLNPPFKIFDGSKDPAVRCRGCGNTYSSESKEWWDDVWCIYCHDVDLGLLYAARRVKAGIILETGCSTVSNVPR